MIISPMLKQVPRSTALAQYPLKQLAELDNTCRWSVGFTPDGTEPGLCHIAQPEPDPEPDPDDPHLFLTKMATSAAGCG